MHVSNLKAILTAKIVQTVVTFQDLVCIVMANKQRRTPLMAELGFI